MSGTTLWNACVWPLYIIVKSDSIVFIKGGDWMTNEIIAGEGKVPVEIRSPEEIAERIQQLDKAIESYSVYGHFSEKGRTLSPENRKKVDILTAKRDELRWFQGEDVKIT